jgi:hypothetical protein
MIPIQTDDGGMRPIVGRQFRKNALDAPLDGVLRDAKLIRNLLVRVPSGALNQNSRDNHDRLWEVA